MHFPIKFLVSIVFGILDVVPVCSYTCSHAVPAVDKVLRGGHADRSNHVVRRSSYLPLRIHANFHASVSELDVSHRAVLKNEIIPASVSFWENTLQVLRTDHPIILARGCIDTQARYGNDSGSYSSTYCVNGCKTIAECGEDMIIPEEHLMPCRYAPRNITVMEAVENFKAQLKSYVDSGRGIADDFLLYVGAVNSNRCQNQKETVAYAGYCQLDHVTDRPIAGYINICPSKVSLSRDQILVVESIVRHEILHALGFSAGLYAYFRDSAGEPYTERNHLGRPKLSNPEFNVYQWSDRVVRKITRRWDTPVGTQYMQKYFVVTPNVVREVQAHFACPTLEGAELENQGVIGTKFTHWEKRLFENEAMTGTWTQDSVISRITLGLLEDTGWYKADYSQAEPLLWGKDQGCEFAMLSCHHWIKSRQASNESISPFCSLPPSTDGSMQTLCPLSRDAVVMCNLVQYSGRLPPQYQVFTQLDGVNHPETYGGSVELADFCPFLQEFMWRDKGVVIRDSDCSNSANNADQRHNYAREWHGNNSACMLQPRPWRVSRCGGQQSVTHWGSGCYKYRCEAGVGLLIEVSGYSYRCLARGQVLRVRAKTRDFVHDGEIVCPGCRELCQNEISCPSDLPIPTVPREPPSFSVPCVSAAYSFQRFSILLYIYLVAFSIL